MDIEQALKALNTELSKADRRFELYACGGAALRLMGIISRDTSDIDVIAEELDPALVAAKDRVARKHALKQSDSETYVIFVDGIINTLKKDLGYK